MTTIECLNPDECGVMHLLSARLFEPAVSCAKCIANQEERMVTLISLQAHISIMEKGSDNQQALILGLQYLVNISYVEADEVLKICLDYWNLFVPDVYTTSQTTDVNAQFSFGPMRTVSCSSFFAEWAIAGSCDVTIDSFYKGYVSKQEVQQDEG